jgi:hypothetical protein
MQTATAPNAVAKRTNVDGFPPCPFRNNIRPPFGNAAPDAVDRTTNRAPRSRILMPFSQKAEMTSRFSFDNPALLRPRMSLYPERLVLTGWRLTGRYQRVIPLRDLLEIDTPGEDRLVLWLRTGNVVRLGNVEDARRWKTVIDDRRPRG